MDKIQCICWSTIGSFGIVGVWLGYLLFFDLLGWKLLSGLVGGGIGVAIGLVLVLITLKTLEILGIIEKGDEFS